MARRSSSDLKSLTISVFSKFCARDLDHAWVTDVCDRHFTDTVEEPNNFNALYDGIDWSETLKSACDVCRMWSKAGKSKNNAEKHQDDSDNEDCINSSSGFWVILVDNDISYKSILALVSFLIFRGHTTVNFENCKTSLWASIFYLNILCVPGSSAFKVFDSMLFQAAIKSLKLPMKMSVQSRKRTANDKGMRKGNKRPRKDEASSQGQDVEEPEATDDNGNPFTEKTDLDMLSPQERSTVIQTINKFMLDLIYCLENFSMRDCSQATEQLIQHLAALTELELTKDLPNSPLKLQSHSIDSLIPLSYKGLSFLCNTFHGDISFITRTVMKYLLPNLLMTGGISGIASSTVIPKSVVGVKDRTISFIFTLLDVVGETGQDSLKILIQHICAKVMDKAEYRSKVAQVVATLLSALHPKTFRYICSWILKYIHNSKVTYRMFGLELLGCILSSKEWPMPVCSEENAQNVGRFSQDTLLCTVIHRCSDKSATVRAKALNVLALCVSSPETDIQNVVKKIVISGAGDKDNRSKSICKEKANSKDCESDKEDNGVGMNADDIDVGSINVDAAGDVVLPSFHDVIGMLQKRACDDKVAVRKAAIQVLEQVICLDVSNVTKFNVSILKDHCMDPGLLVRKQTLQSITSVLQVYPSDAMVQELWVDGVLPLIFDKESSVQQKCGEILENMLLVPVSDSRGDYKPEQIEMAWKILSLISSTHNQDNQQYLQTACQQWAKSGAIKAQTIKALKDCVGGPNDAAVWFLFSSFTINLEVKDPSFIIEQWDRSCKSNQQEGATVERLLRVIGAVSSQIKSEKKLKIIDDLQQQLSSFSSPPELITVMLNTFTKLCRTTKSADASPNTNINKFFTDLLKASDIFLSDIILGSSVSEDDELVVRHLFTLGEVVQLCPKQIPRRIFLLVQSLIATPCITGPAPEKYELTSSQMSQHTQQPLSQFSGSLVKPKIRAHAFITLGKLCLQNEDIAKKSVAAMARELSETSDATIRNNIVVILSDLCVRYTILVDPYMPNVTACLKDPSHLVRRQTLILLIRLLQEDYIKWKGIMFYQLLTVLVDENVQMREFAEYCFISLLQPKQPMMMYHHLVECIFYFNAYKDHESYNKFVLTKKESELFDLSGSINDTKRISVYRFMLESMIDEHKFLLTQKICQDILGAISDGSLPLNNKSYPILLDAFAILYSDEIKLSTLKVSTQEHADDGDMEAVFVATAKKTLITRVVKKNVIENIVPIVISLKHKLEQQKSPLLKELMLYLKELMKDYRHEVKDIMSADKQLAKEIEYDLQKFEKDQQEAIKEQNRLENNIVPRRDSMTNEVFTSPSNHLTIGCTNAKTPRNTRAVLHSARILIESAKRGVARHRSLGSHRFRSFHTPSTSHTVRQEYCSHLSKSESRANKDANHLDSRLLDVDGKLPSDLPSDNLFETEKHKEEGNRVNLNPVQEPCATANKDINMDGQSQQVDESNKSKDEALTVDVMEEANPEIKSEKPSELSPQSSVTSTVIENVQKEVEQLKINVPVKTEKKRDSSKSKTSASPRCITRKSMLRAISTPNTQSSSINDITFANNVSAIDLPTPAVNRNRVKLTVRKRRSSRIKKKP